MFCFFKEYLINRKDVGSVIESSRFLSKSISKLSKEYTPLNGNLLEIGAGLGPISSEIVKLIKDVTLIEINDDFVSKLKIKFNNKEDIKILSKNFMDKDFEGSFDTIVCCLPLSNFSQELNDSFSKKMVSLLKDKGTIIFFEYIGFTLFNNVKKLNEDSLIEVQTLKVIRNFPPAKIVVIQKS